MKPAPRINPGRYPRRPPVPFVRIDIGIECEPRVWIFAKSRADELALRAWIRDNAPDLIPFLHRLAERRAA